MITAERMAQLESSQAKLKQRVRLSIGIFAPACLALFVYATGVYVQVKDLKQSYDQTVHQSERESVVVRNSNGITIAEIVESSNGGGMLTLYSSDGKRVVSLGQMVGRDAGAVLTYDGRGRELVRLTATAGREQAGAITVSGNSGTDIIWFSQGAGGGGGFELRNSEGEPIVALGEAESGEGAIELRRN